MTPEQQKLHNAIGNVIGTEKHELFERLKAGIALEVALSQFLFYTAHALAELLEKIKAQNVADSPLE